MSTLQRVAGGVTPAPAPNGPLGIFGGTFDPIHYGHLRTAFELLQRLSLAEVRFIPVGTPAHRDNTLAPASVRLAMVQAAIAGQLEFTVDEREIRKATPSYTIDTLEELRVEFPSRPLCLCVGMDAFLGLSGWHRWSELLNFAHLVVAHRPGWQAPTDGLLGTLLASRGTVHAEQLHASPAGRIFIHAVTQLEISSTEVRSLLDAGRDPRYLMPDSVRQILLKSGWYARKEKASG